MAQIVIGIGSSHSPALLMDPPAWLARAAVDDQRLFALHDHEGKRVTYEELLAKADPAMAEQVTPERMHARHEANQAAMERISKSLRDANPDVVIIFGDDHKEVFQEDNMPSISIYWGQTLPYKAQGIMKWKYHPALKQDLWYPQDEREYPIASEHAARLIENLMATGFDIAQSRYYRPEQGMSHSFGYVYRRMMTERVIPAIPISINTYYPPNQISPLRAFELGRAIRNAVEAWPEPLRVAVMATGGLSHFVIDEKFDREFLEILASGKPEGHAGLPLVKLQSGNSEFRCWSALAGAVGSLRMELVDYVPCYRSLAGTGCAMAFATWT